MELKLGMTVIHTPTRFVGTITGNATYLYQEPQFLVEGNDRNGLPVERWWPAKSLEEFDNSNCWED